MYDIIIVGGGIAGATASIISARNRLKTLLLDKGTDHSVIGSLGMVSDMPGINDKISGAELLERLKTQAKDAGVEVKNVSVTSCLFEDSKKRVTTNEPATYESSSVILATGNMIQQEAHVYPGEREFLGKGVSHDVETDAPKTKQTPVAIVGKSVSTAESVLRLATYAEKIYWVVPASKLDVSEELEIELSKIKKLEILYSSSLKKIIGGGEVSSVTVLTGGQEKIFSIKYIFLPSQQYKPVTDYLNGSNIQTSTDGCIMVDETFQTNIHGVFAAGNILCLKPQLNVVAAAQGAIAALNAEKALSSRMSV